MDTGLLRGFAVGARVDLLKEVGARLDVVLASGSVERAEAPGSVAALERAVGKDGRDAVVDRAAYTWFNRIIALRFMDTKGYTGVGVVSPEPGKVIGQPQVLSDAKGGDFDAEVVSGKTQTTVIALLNGTRPSADPQGEAYGLLLEAYCRFWNKAMPFMFEREGDYTELLMPTALLATGSVRDRAVRTLTDEVCGEVEVVGWLYQFYISERKDEVFAGFKKSKKAGAAEIPAATQLFTPDWIVRYLVENSLGRLWLLNHPESQLAERMDYYIPPVDEETDFLRVSSPEELKIIDPAVGSGHMLTYAFDLLYAIYEEQAYSPSEIPSKILENNLYGAEIDPRAGALAAFALTMKAAKKRKLFLKNPVQPHVRVLENVRFEQADLDYLWSLTLSPVVRSDADAFWNAFEHADTFGSLIQPDEAMIPVLRSVVEELEATGNLLATPARRVLDQADQLSTRYHIVVANPPYMGRGAMNDRLIRLANAGYPSSKSDLFAMFIDRARLLAVANGAAAMVTMQSWMFLPSLHALRHSLLSTDEFSTFAHIGARGFDSIGGEVVQTCAFVMWMRRPFGRRTAWQRLVHGRSEAEKSTILLSGEERFLLDQRELLRLPNDAMGYWLSSVVRSAYSDGSTVGDLVISDGQTKTGDNDRFLRFWWEVSRTSFGWGRKWVMHPKGGGNRRWFGNASAVIDWSESARTHYRSDRVARILPERLWNRPGICWSNISTSAALGFRVLEPGEVFNLKAPTVFLEDHSRRSELLGYLNSPVASYIINALNPTISFNLNDVVALPWRESDPAARQEVSENVDELVKLARDDWNSSEGAEGFARDKLVATAGFDAPVRLRDTHSEWRARLALLRSELVTREAVVFGHFIQLFDLAGELAPGAEPERDTLRDVGPAELAQDLVSYAVGCMFGRYSLDMPGLVLANQGDSLQEYLAHIASPSFMPDADGVIPVVDGEWFEDDIVAKFRQFLRVAFGEEHFEENLKFVIDSLKVKDLRDYFVKSFYKEHVQRYKKRPIYWMFSSPQGSFSALVYLHRYKPSTVSTVLNEYLREFIKKLEVSLEQQERLVVSGATAREVAAAQKETERLRKVLIELGDYERDLYELASHQIDLDLDDGVLVNYQKFGAALKDIGLKKGDENA